MLCDTQKSELEREIESVLWLDRLWYEVGLRVHCVRVLVKRTLNWSTQSACLRKEPSMIISNQKITQGLYHTFPDVFIFALTTISAVKLCHFLHVYANILQC